MSAAQSCELTPRDSPWGPLWGSSLGHLQADKMQIYVLWSRWRARSSEGKGCAGRSMKAWRGVGGKPDPGGKG